MSDGKLSGRMQFRYLENLVRRVICPEVQVFDSYATSQVLPFADSSEPAATAEANDAYKLLPQKIRSWQ